VNRIDCKTLGLRWINLSVDVGIWDFWVESLRLRVRGKDLGVTSQRLRVKSLGLCVPRLTLHSNMN
jgi:hypothetical protein